MSDDIWTALVRGVLAFGHTRVAGFVGTAFKDAGSFVASLAEDPVAQTPETKSRFTQLKKDIDTAAPVVEQLMEAIKPKIAEAKTAIGHVADELGAETFTMEAAARAATEFAFLLKAVDDALLIVADKISRGSDGAVQPAMKAAIAGMTEPWKRPFRGIGVETKTAFDDVAKQLLDVNNASQKLADRVSFSRAEKLLKLSFAKEDRKSFGALSLEQTELFAFLSYKEKAIVGIKLNTKLAAGLRSDKLVEKVIPAGADPEAESSMITLDTDRGLSFGDGKNRKLSLPTRFSSPVVELREFAIGLPADDGADAGRIEISATVAGKIGSIIGGVIEGTGVTVRWQENGADRFAIEPLLPTGIGMRIDAGIVKGGGFIKRADKEYSGILDLKIGEIRLTAIGMLVTDPFSFVVLLSVQFMPAIELSFGFTLNGLGGILAINRRIATDVLQKGIQDGTANALLFPESPIDAAKTILDKVREAFPPQEGGFVVGPMAKLGWGSQAGFVSAKLGLMIGLPDPKIVLLGALQVAVPSVKVDEKLRIVDLHAEILSVITPEYISFFLGLSNSKIAQMAITGDIGLLIRWAGGAEFALSVGGFFPGYSMPAELTGLRRIKIDLSPAKWLQLYVEAYFALTPNSVQFGGGIHLEAKVGPAKGKAWLTLDALFKWAPRFYFEVRITAGLSISVWGHDFANVGFEGTLKGTTPWRIHGTATIDVWFLPTVHFDIGPFSWGDSDNAEQLTLSPLTLVATALKEDSAWMPQLPPGTDTIARFILDDVTPLLVHPLGMLEVKQLLVPLDTKLDRIGSAKVTANRVSLVEPMVQNVEADIASPSVDQFSPGEFQQLSEEQQLSSPSFVQMNAGMRVAATAAPVSGPSTSVAYEWETRYPHRPGTGRMIHPAVFGPRWNALSLRTNAVSTSARLYRNPYIIDPEPIELRDSGLREARHRFDLSAVSIGAGLMDFSTASELQAVSGVGAELELLAAGVL
jgi:hypothetical protein